MKKGQKNIGVAAITLLLIVCGTNVSYAGTWKQSGEQWNYDNGDGTILRNGWYWLDGNYDGYAECYYFDANGVMASDKVINGNQVNSDGAWISNGQIQRKSSVASGTNLLNMYISLEKNVGILCEEIVDCGSYYELKNFTITYVKIDGIYGIPMYVPTKETVYLSKGADIEWRFGDDSSESRHYTPKEYPTRYEGFSSSLDAIRLLDLKFDANGWIIGGFDVDAG